LPDGCAGADGSDAEGGGEHPVRDGDALRRGAVALQRLVRSGAAGDRVVQRAGRPGAPDVAGGAGGGCPVGRSPSCAAGKLPRVARPRGLPRVTSERAAQPGGITTSASDESTENAAAGQASPVGTMPAPSTIRITVRSGARGRCRTPFGT